MQIIPTLYGPGTFVDDEDFDAWSDFAWGTSEDGYPCAYFQIKPRQVYLIRLHRLIACPAKGQFVHHKNRSVFDNRRENLACVTAAEHAKLHSNVEALQRMAERGLTSWNLLNLWRIEEKIRQRNEDRRR